MGNPPAGWLRRLSFTRLQNGRQQSFAIVNLIHCRRVRRRNLSAKGCPPTKGCLPADCQPLF
ncbi:MAG: hypothetical protein LBK82_01040 [Planctomycetaceae bacterium]|nr:hypothetical protein [Planctomycetaceae bacterium]